MRKSLNKEVNVGFILHPLNVSEFYEKKYIYFPYDKILGFLVKNLSSRFTKKIYSMLPPHKFLYVKDFQLKNRKMKISGYMCPAYPEDFIRNKKNVFLKLKKSLILAVKHKCNVIVLTGFTSIYYAQYSETLESFVDDNIILTSGNTLTAALAFKGILNALEMFGIDSKKKTIAVIGATGDIGSISAFLLAKYFKKIVLCSRKITETDSVVIKLRKVNNNLTITTSINEAVKEADCILLATNSILPLISPNEVNAKTIICDISLPYNVSSDFLTSRNDVFVFDGGKAKIVNNSVNVKWKSFTKNNTIYGCIAEGIILGGDKSIKFSVKKGEIEGENIYSILEALFLNDMDVADYAFHGEKYTTEELEKYKLTFKK